MSVSARPKRLAILGATVVVGVGVFVLGVSGPASEGASEAGVLRPDRSISSIRLGESLHKVTEDVGPGQRHPGGRRAYRVGGISLYVQFNRGDRVARSWTHSPRTRLYGHRLAAPFRSLAPTLRHHDWHVFPCGDAHLAFHARHRRHWRHWDSTELAWLGQKIKDIEVSHADALACGELV